MNKEALEKLFQIVTKQQKVINKLAQPAPLTMRSPTRTSPAVYMDPESDLNSDLKESVRSLTNESISMGDLDDPPASNTRAIRTDFINTISFKMQKHFPNISPEELKLKVLNAISALGL